jgi:hypothetical protein
MSLIPATVYYLRWLLPNLPTVRLHSVSMLYLQLFVRLFFVTLLEYILTIVLLLWHFMGMRIPYEFRYEIRAV